MNNDKAIDALNKLFDLTEKPESAELYKTIRQALTPQSSAGMGKVRAQPSETPVAEKVRDILMRFQSQIASSPIGRAGSDVLYTVKHNERDREELREALALLDQQAAPLNQKAYLAHEVPEDMREAIMRPSPLTELKAAVEGMKQDGVMHDKRLVCSNPVVFIEAWEAALSAVADKIDEMIRRG